MLLFCSAGAGRRPISLPPTKTTTPPPPPTAPTHPRRVPRPRYLAHPPPAGSVAGRLFSGQCCASSSKPSTAPKLAHKPLLPLPLAATAATSPASSCLLAFQDELPSSFVSVLLIHPSLSSSRIPPLTSLSRHIPAVPTDAYSVFLSLTKSTQRRAADDNSPRATTLDVSTTSWDPTWTQPQRSLLRDILPHGLVWLLEYCPDPSVSRFPSDVRQSSSSFVPNDGP
jgi:hypothetical protein